MGILEAMSVFLQGRGMDASHVFMGDCRTPFLQPEGATYRPIELGDFSWEIIFGDLILIEEEKD